MTLTPITDRRLEDLRRSYAYLMSHPGLDKDRTQSDEQHLSLICELQSFRRVAGGQSPDQLGDQLISERDTGADFVLDRLAKALGLEQWVQHDGSETWDGDVAATLWHILYDAKVIDPETNDRVGAS